MGAVEQDDRAVDRDALLPQLSEGANGGAGKAAADAVVVDFGGARPPQCSRERPGTRRGLDSEAAFGGQ